MRHSTGCSDRRHVEFSILTPHGCTPWFAVVALHEGLRRLRIGGSELLALLLWVGEKFAVWCYQVGSVRAAPGVVDKSAYVVPVAAVMPGNTDVGHAVSSTSEITLAVFAMLEMFIQALWLPL